MTGPYTGPALLSKESSESFLSVIVCDQEIKYAFVQKSPLEVGVQQMGEGGSSDLEKTVHLRSLGTNSRQKLKLKSESVPLACLVGDFYTFQYYIFH